MKMSYALRALLVVAVTAINVFDASIAADITVGSPNGGWDLSTDYQTWAASQTFKVGDNLVFQYSSGSHNVLEVPKADHDSCTTSSPIQRWSSGSDSIALSSAGTRYFICGFPGHCAGGMKLTVNVEAATPSTPTTTSTPPPSGGSSPTTPPPPPPSVAQGPGADSLPPTQSSGAEGGLKAKVAGVSGLGLLAALAI